MSGFNVSPGLTAGIAVAEEIWDFVSVAFLKAKMLRNFIPP